MEVSENVPLKNSSNQLNNNLFSELSNESLHKLDEVLNSDSVKQLLSDSKNLEHLAASILDDKTSMATTVTSSTPSTSKLVAPGHVATVQEGLDLVDALDSLVNQLTANQPHQQPEVDLLGGNLEIGSTIEFVDSIFLDHNYASIPVRQQFTRKAEEPTPIEEIEANFTYSTNSSLSPPSTPQRRSQRQIERIEKSVLEKIKAENQEMLKREKEEMEAAKVGKPPDESLKRQSTEMEFDENFGMKEELADDERQEDELIIDFDPEKKKPTKRRGRKKMRTSSENSAVKVKIENKRRESTEKMEIDDSELAELSKLNSSNTSSQRTQRQRRKPKRWDDDEVEVDFSGTASELGTEQTSREDKKTLVKKENVIMKTDKDEGESHEGESEDGGEDDPNKLWCICRQPHNNRFMISCDGCDEWFHGNCVNVTRAMGRAYEKERKKWYCIECKEKMNATLSPTPPQVLIKPEVKKEPNEPISNAVTMQKQVENTTPKKIITKQKVDEKKPSGLKKVKNAEKMKIGDMIKQNKLKHSRFSHSGNAKEKNEQIRLKKLMKSSTAELKKKMDKIEKEKLKAEKEEKWEPISKVVPLVRKSEEKKKKLKHHPVDLSFNDLFKAEPIIMPKKSLSSPSTPSTPSSISTKRQSFPGDGQKKAILLTGEQNCIACGKSVQKGAIKSKESSVYCSENCIEKYVKESLEIVRSSRSQMPNAKCIDKTRIDLIEKCSGRLLAGNTAILEEKVLDFIKSNPTFEIMKASMLRRVSTGQDDKKKDPKLSTPKIAGKKKEESKPKLETVPKPPTKSEEKGSETIRLSVKKTLRETLWTRCQEADNKMLTDDIVKIAYKIEEELFNYFNKETGNKYKTKYRSLVFNLKDPKNQGLFRKVLTGNISPERLVRMSPEELASSELAKWRERENKHAIEMIKRDAEQMSQQVIVKKTHKGEEVIETKATLETIDSSKEEDIPKSIETQHLHCPTPSTPLKEKSFLSSLDILSSDGKSDDKRKEEDSTDKHGQHLYDLHCKICTKQTKQDLSLTHFKARTPNSPTKNSDSKVSQPKRVRVEFDEPTNKIIEEAAKLSRSAKVAKINDSFVEPEDPLTSSISSSPEAPNQTSKPKLASCWKGFIFMQDMAKFVASAYKVSGIVESQIKDVPDTVTVCGRIAPEQVLDYLKKLKYSRAEISVIRFAPANQEEKVGYEAFFTYLNGRKRYGVVSGTGKSIKDFYILPLPKDVDPPSVLLPFDGPGLEKTSRPNLLLGILVKSKKRDVKSVKERSDQREPREVERSYTPPPPISSKSESVEEPYDPAISLTPPLREEPKKEVREEEEPYDPEENDLNIPPTTQGSMNISDLLDQLSKSTDPAEMTSTFLGTVAKNATIEEQKQLLEELTKKVEDSKRQLEEQRKAAEAAFTIASRSIDGVGSVSNAIPGLDGDYPTEESKSSLFDHLQVPDNLKEILANVQAKSQESNQTREEAETKIETTKRITLDDPIVKHFGQNLEGEEDFDDDDDGLDEGESEEKKVPEPMELEEEDEGSSKAMNIIEVNNTKAIIDPRLRSKKQIPLDSTLQASEEKKVSQLQDDELMMKAKLQLEALKMMEEQQKRLEEAQKQAIKALGKNEPPSAGKLKIEWKKSCKPGKA